MRVAYSGDPFAPPVHGLLDTGEPLSFVSPQGWELPPGTWYPLVGPANDGTHFVLRLKAPPGYLSLTPYGDVRGSTPPGHPIQGTGETLQVVGGHLARVADVGRISIYAAADQLREARQATHGAFAPISPCLTGLLTPSPVSTVVWALPEGMVLAPDQAPWLLDGETFPNYFDGSAIGGSGGATFAYEVDVQDFTDLETKLWLNDGRRTEVPGIMAGRGGAFELAASLVRSCHAFSPLFDTSSRIPALPAGSRHTVALRARRLYLEGRLTPRAFRGLVDSASNP